MPKEKMSRLINLGSYGIKKQKRSHHNKENVRVYFKSIAHQSTRTIHLKISPTNHTYCIPKRKHMITPSSLRVSPRISAQVIQTDAENSIPLSLLSRSDNTWFTGYCELNFIEQCWGHAKWVYWMYLPSSKESDLQQNVLSALESVPLINMQQYV